MAEKHRPERPEPLDRQQRMPPEQKTRSGSGQSSDTGEPFRGRHGYGEGGYYNQRGQWQVSESSATIQEDQRIEQEIWTRVEQDGRFRREDILVEVHAGDVTIKGVVDGAQAKADLGEIAGSVDGVKDVHNQILVRQA